MRVFARWRKVAVSLFIAVTGMLLVALVSVSASTLALPAVVGGRVTTREAGTRALSAAELTVVLEWLKRHGSGWGSNYASPPVAEVLIELDAAENRPALTLSLWPRQKAVSWRTSVIVEGAGIGGSPRIQGFTTGEFAQLPEVAKP